MKTLMLLTSLVCLLNSCKFGSRNRTPNKFLSKVQVDHKTYSKDSLLIIRQLKMLLIYKKNPFDNPAYTDSTEFIVDTLLYSDTSLNRLAAFILVKNSTNRQLIPAKAKGYAYYYDGYCYIGIKRKYTDTIAVKRLTNLSLSSWYDEGQASSELRNMYFNEFSTLKDTSGVPLYGHNLDDKRFWTSKVWKKYFDEE